MKIILTFLLLTIALSSSVLGQTKAETEAWIMGKLNSYNLSEGGIITGYSSEFKGGKFIQTAYYPSGDGNRGIINLRLVTAISIVDHKDTRTVVLSCIGRECVTRIDYDHASGMDLPSEHPQTDKVIIVFPKSFTPEDIPSRVVKAFTHLVELHGGKVAGEKF